LIKIRLQLRPCLRSHLYNILNALLAIDLWQRPSASTIARVFGSYSLLLRPSIAESIDEVNALPPFGQWQELVESAASERQLLSELARLSEKNAQYKVAANPRRALVEMFPAEESLQNELAEDGYSKVNAGSAWLDLPHRQQTKRFQTSKSTIIGF
jgi:hypothetical protein